MAFFSKLKERLFRSSSKLDEGLDAIVEDGGEEEVLETPVEEVLVPDPVLEEPSPEREREHILCIISNNRSNLTVHCRSHPKC